MAHRWVGHRAFIRRSHGPGWALVGSAGFFKDPSSAHGFTDSLRDAELLARAVGRGIPDAAALDRALAWYQDTRDSIGTPVFDCVERIANGRWSHSELGRVLQQLGSAMADEVELLAETAATEPGAP